MDTMNEVMAAQFELMAEKASICELLQNWGLWRDLCDWPALKGAYAPGAIMQTTWFNGPAVDFVDATMRMSGGAARAQHYFGAPLLQVNGTHAVAKTRVTILVRGPFNGIEVDATCHGWFVDRLVKRDGAWLIANRVPLYDKDMLSAVDPAVVLVLDAQTLARFPAPYKHMAYMQSLAGATFNAELPLPGSAGQDQLLADCQSWLAAGTP